MLSTHRASTFSEELGSMSKNNLRGIILGVRPISGGDSLSYLDDLLTEHITYKTFQILQSTNNKGVKGHKDIVKLYSHYGQGSRK